MEAINKEILIEGVDPRELYGAQDAYLELMRELSPKVKIVARGSSLKALGAKRRAEVFATPSSLADLQFVESLSPDVSIRVLHSGEGTLWTDLKGASIAVPKAK